MRLEGDDKRSNTEPVGMLFQSLEQILMTTVQAIEVANGDGVCAW